MLITALVEDTVHGRDLLAEHGLAFWIEVGSKRILFDTGQGTVLRDNARRLGVGLETADAIVLSHGHYDHAGGLGDALGSDGQTAVYAHPAAFQPKYAQTPHGAIRNVGATFPDKQVVDGRAELIWVEEPTEVCPGLRLTGPVPRTTDFEDTGGAFFQDQDCTRPDDLPDDQAAFVDTPAGTVVILGCAHAGLVNTLRYIQTLTENRPIHAVLGGMHLHSASAERMDKTVAALRRLDVQRMQPCHCTGFEAMARLWHEFPDRCASCPVGTVVSFAR